MVSNEENGMLDDFELYVAHLLPVCPVTDKVANKRKNTQISGLGGDFKAGTVPKTGVELQYHKPHEFSQISDSQIDEILELRPPKKGRGEK